IFDAVGVRIHSLPATAEKVLRAIKENAPGRAQPAWGWPGRPRGRRSRHLSANQALPAAA
ncbi:MAG: hypothetical protein QGF16_18975, partial [Rhodospirillales bacterium]|nr:hypothetical protein [Rhodospirillales bacterium]